MSEELPDTNVIIAGLYHDLVKKRSFVTLTWTDAADKRLVLDVPFGCSVADLPIEAERVLRDFSAQIAAVPIGLPYLSEEASVPRQQPGLSPAVAQPDQARDLTSDSPQLSPTPAAKLEADPEPLAVSFEEIRERVGQLVGPQGAAEAQRNA